MKIASLWFQPEVDLFGTRWNHKLPKFVCLAPDALAWERDALSLDWKGGSWYAYPPFGLLLKITKATVQTSFGGSMETKNKLVSLGSRVVNGFT